MKPLLLSIGFIHISSLSVFLLLAFLIGLFTVWKRSKEKLYAEDVVFDSFVVAVLALLVGGRICYIASHFSIFGWSIGPMFFFNAYPGFDPIGGFIIALFIIWWWFRKRRDIPVWQMIDTYVTAFCAAFVIGSVGAALDGVEQGRTYLYRALSLMAILVIVGLLRKRIRIASGFVGIILLGCFLTINVLVDFLTVYSVYYWNLSISQWESLMLLIALIPISYIHAGKRVMGGMRYIFNRIKRQQKSYGEISKKDTQTS